MNETADGLIEIIYQRIKNSTSEIKSVVPNSGEGPLSKDDIFLFHALRELIFQSELIVVPPLRNDDIDGVYKFKDIYFYRLCMPADDGLPEYENWSRVQLVRQLSKDEASEKKRNWSIEGELIEEMISASPSEEKIGELQRQLGEEFTSPYTLVPTPYEDKSS